MSAHPRSYFWLFCAAGVPSQSGVNTTIADVPSLSLCVWIASQRDALLACAWRQCALCQRNPPGLGTSSAEKGQERNHEARTPAVPGIKVRPADFFQPACSLLSVSCPCTCCAFFRPWRPVCSNSPAAPPRCCKLHCCLSECDGDGGEISPALQTPVLVRALRSSSHVATSHMATSADHSACSSQAEHTEHIAAASSGQLL